MSDGKVYVMQDASGLVKVGKSQNPIYRQNILATGNPTIKLLFSTELMTNYSSVESECHKMLSDFLVCNEWFNCESSLAIETVKSVSDSMGKLEEPKEKHDDQVVKRINCAVNAGFKASVLAKHCGISRFRFASAINPDSYRGSTRFSEEEVEHINKTLDRIQDSL